MNALVPDSKNLLIYSRPAAYADLTLSLDQSATPNARITLNSAILQITYDFTQRNRALKQLKIGESENGFDVEIDVSTKDRNERADGHGGFERTFDSNRLVILTAPESVGGLRFVRWEGFGISDPLAREQIVQMTEHRYLRPVYEPQQRYTLTVNGGEGSGTYFPGERVEIMANGASTFLRWEGGNPSDPDNTSTIVPVIADTVITHSAGSET